MDPETTPVDPTTQPTDMPVDPVQPSVEEQPVEPVKEATEPAVDPNSPDNLEQPVNVSQNSISMAPVEEPLEPTPEVKSVTVAPVLTVAQNLVTQNLVTQSQVIEALNSDVPLQIPLLEDVSEPQPELQVLLRILRATAEDVQFCDEHVDGPAQASIALHTVIKKICNVLGL